MTVVCAGGPLGTAGGQALAGTLVDNHGHRAAFVLAPALAGLALLLALGTQRRRADDVLADAEHRRFRLGQPEHT